MPLTIKVNDNTTAHHALGRFGLRAPDKYGTDAPTVEVSGGMACYDCASTLHQYYRIFRLDD